MKKSLLGCLFLVTAGCAFATEEKKIVHPFKDAVPPAKVEVNEASWLDNFSGSMTLTSNYVFRGLTQTMNLPAVQGSLYYTFPIGIYLNAWASNVKFNDDSGASIEIDTIAGYKNTIGENFSYDLSIDQYNYPGARQINYAEFIALFNYWFFQASYAYSGNYAGTHTTSQYINGGINYTIPNEHFIIEDVTITALIGRSTFNKNVSPDYTDYSIAVAKKFKNYTLSLGWTGTNGNLHNPPIDDNHFIAQWTANFG